MYLFEQSNLVCINEISFQTHEAVRDIHRQIPPSEVRLTYFKNNEFDKPYHQYSFRDREEDYINLFRAKHRQGNHHSLVYYLKLNQVYNGEIKFHDLEIKNGTVQSRIRKVTFPHFQEKNIREKGQADFWDQNSADGSIWQVKKEQFIVVPYVFTE